MTREDAKHIVDVAFGVPQAVRRAGEDRTYHEDEIREAKKMAIKALEQEPTTKNDLGVDCISREQALVAIRNLYPGMPRVDFNGSLRKWVDKYKPYIECDDAIKQLPAVTPQEPQTFKWCDTCKEYDQEKHCCHRWSKVIRDTVEEMKQEQEPRWIPVSERLPEPYMFVNVTCRSLVDDREDWVVETIYLPIPKEHNPRHYSDWGNIPMLNWGDAEVIAWVERIIPKPYKAESEDKE